MTSASSVWAEELESYLLGVCAGCLVFYFLAFEVDRTRRVRVRAQA